MSDTIKLERRGASLVITINRPLVRNAMNAEAARALTAALDMIDADDSIFLAILTGAGGYFSAGADLKVAAVEGRSGAETERGAMGMVRRPPKKPLIAVVEGGAFGGGFEMVLACDLIVAADDAFMGLLEVSRNLVATGGGALRLPLRLPYHLAAEVLLTGGRFPAAFFHQHGLVNRLVAPGTALTSALDLAETLLANGPTALAATVQILRHASSWTEEEGWTAQYAFARPALDSSDRREGVRAFVEKRPPVWTGR